MTENEKEAVRRCEYASELLTKENIPHEIKKKEIGHINLYYLDKVVMSFWARTGKFIYLTPPESNFKRRVNEDDRGIKTCIRKYKEEFR